MTYFIGHRGVGKSSLVQSLQDVVPEFNCYDLDKKIETETQLSVDQIFAQKGEAEFRQIEIDTLSKVITESRDKDVAVALGAGFQGELIDQPVVWLQRPSDVLGRVFFDRPRLNNSVSAINEFKERFKKREQQYSKKCTYSIELMEGFDRDPEFLKILFSQKVDFDFGGILTLNDSIIFNLFFNLYVQQRLLWKSIRFEIRDDLVSEAGFEKACSEIPSELLIISRRTKESWVTKDHLLKVAAVDWPLELGEPEGPTDILSLHETKEGESVSAAAKRLTSSSANHYKLAPMIQSLEDLAFGYFWWLEDPKHRSFLPRSNNGKWSWLRLWIGDRQKLNFIREGRAPVADQPSLHEWFHFRNSSQSHFAAVMGAPVEHSQTPRIQKDFFYPCPVFKIELKEDELSETSLVLLSKMGLKWSAVTSPLKNKAFQLCQSNVKIPSVNTLYYDGNKWLGTNTDTVGFRTLVNPFVNHSIAVWGGGGTLDMMKQVLPKASYYSARSGEIKFGQSVDKPQVVIWGVGRSRMEQAQWPHECWSPEVVIDLNYSEDSPGREYAINVDAKYINGIEMLRAQGLAQQEFWNGCQ